MEEALTVKSRMFISRLLQTALERDRESDDSDNDPDDDISASGYLLCLVNSLLNRFRESAASTGVGLISSSDQKGTGVDVISKDDDEAGNASEGVQSVEEAEEDISDPVAQRVPSPRVSGGKSIHLLVYIYILLFI